MKTDIYESDPFTPQRGRLLATLESEYRFESGDELFIDAPERMKVRVINVRVHIKHDGEAERDVLVLPIT